MAEEDVERDGYKYNYGPEYDAIFMQWMMAYGQATGQGYWLQLAEVNAGARPTDAANAQGLWLGKLVGRGDRRSRNASRNVPHEAATASLFAWTACTRAPR